MSTSSHTPSSSITSFTSFTSVSSTSTSSTTSSFLDFEMEMHPSPEAASHSKLVRSARKLTHVLGSPPPTSLIHRAPTSTAPHNSHNSHYGAMSTSGSKFGHRRTQSRPLPFPPIKHVHVPAPLKSSSLERLTYSMERSTPELSSPSESDSSMYSQPSPLSPLSPRDLNTPDTAMPLGYGFGSAHPVPSCVEMTNDERVQEGEEEGEEGEGEGNGSMFTDPFNNNRRVPSPKLTLQIENLSPPRPQPILKSYFSPITPSPFPSPSPSAAGSSYFPQGLGADLRPGVKEQSASAWSPYTPMATPSSAMPLRTGGEMVTAGEYFTRQPHLVSPFEHSSPFGHSSPFSPFQLGEAEQGREEEVAGEAEPTPRERTSSLPSTTGTRSEGRSSFSSFSSFGGSPTFPSFPSSSSLTPAPVPATSPSKNRTRAHTLTQIRRKRLAKASRLLGEPVPASMVPLPVFLPSSLHHSGGGRRRKSSASSARAHGHGHAHAHAHAHAHPTPSRKGKPKPRGPRARDSGVPFAARKDSVALLKSRKARSRSGSSCTSASEGEGGRKESWDGAWNMEIGEVKRGLRGLRV